LYKYPFYHHFNPHLVYVHAEQYHHTSDLLKYYIRHPITNKFFPFNCWYDSLMYESLSFSDDLHSHFHIKKCKIVCVTGTFIQSDL
jgi:hypothetical protein